MRAKLLIAGLAAVVGLALLAAGAGQVDARTPRKAKPLGLAEAQAAAEIAAPRLVKLSYFAHTTETNHYYTDKILKVFPCYKERPGSKKFRCSLVMERTEYSAPVPTTGYSGRDEVCSLSHKCCYLRADLLEVFRFPPFKPRKYQAVVLHPKDRTRSLAVVRLSPDPDPPEPPFDTSVDPFVFPPCPG